MVNGFDVCCHYLALRLHFVSDYDYLKYKGRIRYPVEKYRTRKDHHIFERIAGKYRYEDQIFPKILANIIETKSTPHIFDMFSMDGDDRYNSWKKRFDSMSYRFSEDLKYVIGTYPGHPILKQKNKIFPNLLLAFYHGDIGPETIVILNDITKGKLIENWKCCISDKALWPDTSKKLVKYAGFITEQYDVVKCKEVAVKLLKK